MDNYLKWLKGDGKSDNTISSYIQIAVHFQKWFHQKVGEESFKGEFVSALDLQEWKSYLMDEATFVRGKRGKPQKYSVKSVITFIKAIK
ncbi:MAG: integrase/recombinase, partial [Paenibacillus sp.]|nr:integrase/recombinase [Paenibacillus sp.]